MDTFDGPWVVLATHSLKGRPRLNRGEIMVHESGNLILNCPACNAMQFTIAKLHNPGAAPSLSKPVLCGAGTCKRCAVLFTIENGVTRILPEQEPEQEQASEAERDKKLAVAGIGPPKDLDEHIREAKHRQQKG